MPNNTKLTEDTEPLYRLFFSVGLPVKIIALAMNVNIVSVRKYLDLLKVDFLKPRGTGALQRHLLELYCDWVTDPNDSPIKNPDTRKRLETALWKELQFEEFSAFVHGAFTTSRMYARLSFADDIPQGERDFAEGVFLYPSLHKPSTDLSEARQIVGNIMLKFHRGTIPLPEARLFLERHEFYASLIRPLIEKERGRTAPTIDLVVMKRIREVFEKKLRRNQKAILEHTYHMGWVTEEELSQMTVTRKRIYQILKESLVACHCEIMTFLSTLEQYEENFSLLERKLSNAYQAMESQRAFMTELRKAEGIKVLASADIPLKVLRIKVSELGLSVKTRNSLGLSGIATIAELINFAEKDLLKFRSLGRKAVDEIKARLLCMGLKLGTKVSEDDLNLVAALR